MFKKLLLFSSVLCVVLSLEACGEKAVAPAASAEASAEEGGVICKYKNGDTVGQVISFLYDDAGDFYYGLAPVKRNDKWGYIDKNGNEIIPFKYDSANIFSYGLACVKINGKFGYIDKNGNEVIPFKYDSANSFSRNGLACVKTDKKYGYIDKNGKEVIPFKYDSANSFNSKDLAQVKIKDKWGYIDKNGKEIIPIKYESSFSFSDGLAVVKFKDKYGCIDESGKEIIPIKYDGVGFLNDDIAHVRLNGKSGYIDKTGKEILPVKYDDIYHDVYDGLYLLKSNNKYELFDMDKRKIISAQYDWIDMFSEGLAAVRLHDSDTGRGGYINKNGEEVIPLKFHYSTSLGRFHDGLAPVHNNNGQEVYIDKNGNEVIANDHYYHIREFSEGLAEVKFDYPGTSKHMKSGYIDSKGNEIIAFKYEESPFGHKFKEGLAAVELNDKYGYIDKNGNEVIQFKYDDADDFYDGFARVEVNGKYGYVNKNGKEVIPIKYNSNEVSLESISEGLARVCINDKYGYMDKNGNIVISIKYDFVGDFKDGLASVKNNGKYGYINKNGDEVIPLKYDSAHDFNKGLAYVSINGKTVYIDKKGKELIYHNTTEYLTEGLKSKYLDGKWGYTNENGNEVVPCVYDLVSYFSEGFAAVCLNGKWGYISYLPEYSTGYIGSGIGQSSYTNNDYYYKDGNMVKNTWAEGRYYGDDGKMYRNKKTPDGKFVNTDGEVVDVEKDFKEIDKNEVEGNAWFKTKNGIWYYFEGDRTTLKKGWFVDPQDEQTYYLDPQTGIMQTGWQKIDGKEYYFNESHDNEPNWYYVAENDTYESYGKKVKAYGSMFKDEKTPDGHYVDINGVKDGDGKDTPIKSSDSADVLNLSVGDTLTFSGDKYSTYITNDDNVVWEVKEIVGDSAYVLPNKVLCAMPFSATGVNTGFNDSTLRTWLNSYFIDDIFSNDEKQNIKEVTLPSLDEIKRWYPNTTKDIWNEKYVCNNDATCEATAYAKAQGVNVYTQGQEWFYGKTAYWLRDDAATATTAQSVKSRGIVGEFEDAANRQDYGVRPLIILNINGAYNKQNGLYGSSSDKGGSISGGSSSSSGSVGSSNGSGSSTSVNINNGSVSSVGGSNPNLIGSSGKNATLGVSSSLSERQKLMKQLYDEVTSPDYDYEIDYNKYSSLNLMPTEQDRIVIDCIKYDENGNLWFTGQNTKFTGLYSLRIIDKGNLY